MSKGIHLHILGHEIDATADQGLIASLPPLAPEILALLDSATPDELAARAARAAAWAAAHVHIRLLRRVHGHLPTPPHLLKE